MIKKILITGIDGMLGNSLINDPRLKKYKVYKISRKNLDLTNSKKLLSYLKRIKPDLIINCAAKVGGIGANFLNNSNFLIENTKINNSLIFSAYKANIKKIINMGSSCMYPTNVKKPISENKISLANLEKTNEGYALAKIFAFKTCELINKNKNFKYKTIVPCNIFGPKDNFNLKTGHMIPAAIKKIDFAMKNKKKFVEIWGSGKPRREFMYVQNLVDFIFVFIRKFNKMPNIINVGINKEFSIKKYYQLIGDKLNYKGKFIFNLNKPDGQMSKMIDSKYARKFGWKPNISLEEGIKRTIIYYKKTKF